MRHRTNGRRAPEFAALALLFTLGAAAPASAQESHTLASPDGRNRVAVEIRDGALAYRLERDDRRILLPSRLGFEIAGAAPLADGLEIAATARSSVDEVWEQPWGETERVRDHHNELRVSVRESSEPGRRFDVVFRAFDDGVAFRYELPEQPGLGAFEITDELTEFRFADDPKAWWIPANDPTHRYELQYRTSALSTLPEVHTPLTLVGLDGLALVIHEADLVDYAGMNLTGNWDRSLAVTLPAWADGVKVRGRTPFRTPWRTIQIADDVTGLQPSVLGLKLNPPSAIADAGWIEPMKYVGIWWGMHIRTETWGSGPLHGANTANTRRYIDFAADNGFGGVLVEGWNQGWDGDWIANADLFSFTTPYPDFDLPGVAAYASERGVTLIGHNETSMGVENYERQIEEAFELYERLGIRALKTGYVGDRTEHGHAHHGQYMVRHWRRVVELAARHRIMLNVHEPIKDTGERRTWPNMMTREGARGMEYNAWAGDGGNPPDHETILYFTRLVSGPMDYTPGVFDILLASAPDGPRTPEQPRVRTTLAKQLALYVVLYSPLQMASDLPENYEDQPAFQFIRDVPVDWSASATLGGRIGDFVVVLRKQRGGPDWYIGAITDEQARSLEVPLAFLPDGESFVAEIYADGAGAHWLHDPLPIDISSRTVDATSVLTLDLAPGGGQAIRIRPAD